MSKNVSIRATLESSQFIGGLRGMGQATESMSKTARHSIREGFTEGLREAGRELKNTGRELKGLFSMAVSLGGAFSFEEGIRGAVKMKGKLSDLAFMVGQGEGKQVSWNEIHEEIGPIAEKTTRSVEELAGAYETLFSKTGNRADTVGSLEAIGTIATASGRSVESLAGIAGELSDKFKISGKAMPEALSQVVELASKGGVQFEELQGVLATTGASALAAGLSGEAGMKKMIGMMNIGGTVLKSVGKGAIQVGTLFDQMVSPDFQKKLNGLQFHVKTLNKDRTARDATAVLEDIITKAKGKREQLAKVFSGKQLDIVLALSGDFKKTFDETKGDISTKTAAARRAFETELAKAGESSSTFADVQKAAAARIDQDPAAALRRAMNKIEEAFMKPQMISAIDKIAEKLPALADALAKFVEYATENPITTAAAVVGGKAALGGAAGFAGSMLKGAFGGGGAAVAAGEGAAVAGAGTAAAGAGATGGLATIAAALGPGGAIVAAIGGLAIAYKEGKDLVEENSHREDKGGVWAAFQEARQLRIGKKGEIGSTAAPVSGDAYDKLYGKGKYAPPPIKLVPQDISTAVEGVKKHGTQSDKVAASMSRLATQTDRLAAYFETLGDKAPGGGGVAKGPKTLGGVTPGSAPRGPSS